jgi:hypothetical protein
MEHEQINSTSGHGREITIIVNGTQKAAHEKELTFLEIVQLAFANAVINEITAYTVTFKRGHGNKPEGSLVNDESVKLKEGMIFNVTATDKS